MLEQRLREAAQVVRDALADASPPPLEDLNLVTGQPSGLVWRRPVLIVASSFVAVLLMIGAIALLTSPESPTIGESQDAAGDYLVPVAVPLGEIQGLARSGTMLWAWDRAGRIAGYFEGSWTSLPSLPDPVVGVAGSSTEAAWAITTNRCDPTLPDWEFVGCETALWHLVEGVWRQPPELGLLPDDLQDIEVDDATGAVWIVSSEGVLHRWDGTEMSTIVDSSRMLNDGIAVTGDGTVWASRFNPYFPDDVGFARLNEDRGAWESFRPLGGENRHAVMAPTPNGDLWVWLSEFPSAESLSGRALAYYDSDTGGWTVHEVDTPEGTVRTMTANTEAVWLTMLSPNARLWQFDGETWTLVNSRPLVEILGVAAAPDGTVWYVQDHALHQLQP